MCDNAMLMKTCKPIKPGTPPITGHELEHLLSHTAGWEVEDGVLTKIFQFEDHYQTMAFVNAVAWV
ncbi:MAG: 4a-hydroxytetrahydrobiopterin dehydratase, partial [Candidatus Sulfomarinibacteraceae bacterium]